MSEDTLDYTAVYEPLRRRLREHEAMRQLLLRLVQRNSSYVVADITRDAETLLAAIKAK